ncbi:MAG: hypothetical protein WC532_00775 [Candidatus Omnitrophota bacterium]
MYNFIIFGVVCILVIFLGFEIRHKEILEAVEKLKSNAIKVDEEIVRLKTALKNKKDIFETHNPPMY